MQEETIRGAEKNSRYEITVRVYNGAGDGPKSQIRYINTPEGSEKFKILFIVHFTLPSNIIALFV